MRTESDEACRFLVTNECFPCRRDGNQSPGRSCDNGNPWADRADGRYRPRLFIAAPSRHRPTVGYERLIAGKLLASPSERALPPTHRRELECSRALERLSCAANLFSRFMPRATRKLQSAKAHAESLEDIFHFGF
jgi:hypothetical protein